MNLKVQKHLFCFCSLLGPWKNIFAINKVQTYKGLQSDQFYSWFLWWNWRNIFAINKVQTSKGLQSDQFCSLFLWYTIWTWKNICHALWSWKSVSLIISLDGLVWTWHNYKYLSIIQLWYVLCTFYHPNCQICNQSLIEKSSSNFQKLFQESNLGPLPENKVDLGVFYIIFR